MKGVVEQLKSMDIISKVNNSNVKAPCIDLSVQDTGEDHTIQEMKKYTEQVT